MSKTLTDTEREQVANILRTGYYGIAETKVINQLANFIASREREAENRGRIDEVENFEALDILGTLNRLQTTNDYVTRRKAELQTTPKDSQGGEG